MDGGQTKENPSAWNVDTLHSHVQAILNDRDHLWMELRKADDKRYEQRFAAQQDALLKAEELAREAKAAANEWRGAMNDREARFLPKEEFRSILSEWNLWRTQTVETRTALANRITIIETRSVTWTAALGIFFILMQIVIWWLSRK